MSKKILSLLLCLFSGIMYLSAGQVERVAEKPFAVSASGGSLTIVNNTGKDATFVVYAITGQVVKSIEVKNDSTTLALPRGFYIVKSDSGAVKVVVK